MEKIQAFVSEQIKTDVPKFGIGDGVKVYVKIVEGEKERTQMFEGTVIARHGGGISETFTVRRVSATARSSLKTTRFTLKNN